MQESNFRSQLCCRLAISSPRERPLSEQPTVSLGHKSRIREIRKQPFADDDFKSA